MSVGTVITALAPDERLIVAVRSVAAQTDRVYVVDNTPQGMQREIHDALIDLPNVEVLELGANIGLAGALNRGLDACRRAGLDLVLLLDQDSSVPVDLLTSLAPHLAERRVAAVGPAPWDAQRDRYIDPRTRWRRALSDRPAIIASGMLVRLREALAIGGFRENFFVDGVDQDFCLRLRARGHRILQDKETVLPHVLGRRSEVKSFPGLRATVSNHPTWRLYWVFRNGLVIAREHWRREPQWVLANLAILARWLLLSALYEAPRRERLRAIAAGCRDGVTGAVKVGYLPEGAVLPVGQSEPST